jgi:hypothetical protein
VLEGHFSQFDRHALGGCWPNRDGTRRTRHQTREFRIWKKCVQTAIVEGSIVEDGNAFEITKELEVLDTRGLARPTGHCWLVLQCRRARTASWLRRCGGRREELWWRAMHVRQDGAFSYHALGVGMAAGVGVGERASLEGVGVGGSSRAVVRAFGEIAVEVAAGR